MSKRKAIVFYCRYCEGWIFACVKNEMTIKDSQKEIIRCLVEGHKMEEIDIDTGKIKGTYCDCGG